MTPRERYLATLRFKTPDKIPFEPGAPRETTLARWRQEGLPRNQDWFRFLCQTIGIEAAASEPTALDLDIDFRMRPTFEEKVLAHQNGHYLVQDWMGNIVEISDAYDYTYLRYPKDFVTRKWHRFPVTTRLDFEQMKRRYQATNPARYPADFATRVQRLKNRDRLSTLQFSGPFWQLREWCGFEPLCFLLMEAPDFVQEMIAFWTEFVLQNMQRALTAGVVDRILISEDMAYKEKAMISPAMTRTFLLPTWKKWIDTARQAGVQLFDMDSDGKVNELIPLWMEAGFNVCDPIEVAAGNDLLEYHQTYCQKMAYRQGIDKRCLAQGSGAMTAELARLTPVIRAGGFIPGCDHAVPPDISWPAFVDYARLLAELTGWR